MREIVIDTETTGLYCDTGDKIIDIACIELIDKEPTGRFFQSYIYPERLVPEESTLISGLTNEFLQDKPRFIEIVDDFLEFIKNDPIIAHNAQFDIGFINNELKHIFYPLLKNQVIDTLAIARQKFQSNVSLNALCKRYKISLASRKVHGALIDCKLLAKIYGFLCFEEDNFSFSTQSQNKTSDISNFHIREAQNLTDTEITLHKEFILKLKISDF